MNKTTAIFACTVGLLGAPSAFALPIASVGGVDTIVDYGNVAPNEASQQVFIADYFSIDAEDLLYTKIEGSIGDSSGEGGAWEQADDNSNVWYLDFSQFLSYDPLAFLIKTGNNVGYLGGGYNTFLYSNDNRYGVIDLSLFAPLVGKNRIFEIDVVSHVSTGGAVSVPEPGSLSLLGAGLLAAAFCRRRKKQVA